MLINHEPHWANLQTFHTLTALLGKKWTGWMLLKQVIFTYQILLVILGKFWWHNFLPLSIEIFNSCCILSLLEMESKLGCIYVFSTSRSQEQIIYLYSIPKMYVEDERSKFNKYQTCGLMVLEKNVNNC